MNEVRRLAEKIFRCVGAPYAQEMLELLEKDDWVAIQSRRSNPLTATSAAELRRQGWAYETFRKLLIPGTSSERKQKAVTAFWQSESQCKVTNQRMKRLANLRQGLSLYDSPLEIQMVDFITKWRREVRLVLGTCPSWLEFGFSPGSTMSNSGNLTTIPDKLETPNPTVYPSSFPYNEMLNGTPFFLREVEVTRGNRFFTVPKDSEKDRGCCMEALLPVGFQLAVGKLLKQRYRKRFKVDLRYAKEEHMELARMGSLDGTIATIDLSSASDTVARELVRLILPTDWLRLLESLRAPITYVNDQPVFLEKFSSMGNGFTFELETIIFRTLIATLGIPGMVFGDDIIVPSVNYKMVFDALSYFGFTPNMKKTFGEGPFRESCGGDYYQGEAVRPYYLENIPTSPQQWIGVANGLRRADPGLTTLRAAWRYAIDQVPIQFRVFGPEWMEDSVIHVDEPEQHRVWRVHKTYAGRKLMSEQTGFFYRCLVPQHTAYDLGSYWKERDAMVAAALGQHSRVVPRNSKLLGFKLSWVPATKDLIPCADWLPTPG